MQRRTSLTILYRMVPSTLIIMLLFSLGLITDPAQAARERAPQPTILDRLEKLEKKVEQAEEGTQKVSPAVLERLHRLESQASDRAMTKPAGAQTMATQDIQTRIDALEKKTEAESIWKTLGFKASGAVDVAYTHNLNNPSTNLNQLHIFDTNANAFMPHLVQFMLERPADAAGSGLDRAGFRARLNFGLDARVTRARTNFQPGVASDEMDFQELYAEYILPIGNGFKIQAGKMNTLIGYEVINSWENPNFSRTFMFGLGQAFTTTGIRASYQFNSVMAATVGLVNGWDNVDDNNKGKTVEWLLALTPHERFGISFYGSYGAEQSNCQGGLTTGGSVCTPYTAGYNPSAKRLVGGSIITFKPTKSDTIVLEPFYGNEEQANLTTARSGKNARWNGLGAYLIHDFDESWSLRLRGEIFEDAGGTRTCTGGTIGTTSGFSGVPGGWNTCANSSSGGVAQTLWESTSTIQYKPVPSLITRIEFRYDKSDRNVFLYGSRSSNHQETASFQVVYLF
ncbi:MAG: porin [Nitrospira sp.]|nr:porin [Nitrospira sp.]